MAAAVQNMPNTPLGKLERYVQVEESKYECQLVSVYFSGSNTDLLQWIGLTL